MKLRYWICLIILLAPIGYALAMDVDDNQQTTQYWIREDTTCSGWEPCQKTTCKGGGTEQCQAQYCNISNCGDR